MVVSQWAPTVCRPPRICVNKQLPHLFVLHGAWPVDTSNPQTHLIPDPNAAPFNMSLFTEEQKQLLKQAWPDIKNGNDIKFSEEQWNKHGKASNLEQVAYFMKAYNLMLINNLDIKLRNAGLTPRPSPYRISAFKKDAAREMEGVEPILVCLGRKNNR